MKLWNLGVFAMLGLVSIVYGLIRFNLVDIALGIAVLVGGSLAYVAWWRRP